MIRQETWERFGELCLDRLSERVALAQALRGSIDADLPDSDEREAVVEAIRRDEELSSGSVAGRTHEEVMRAARRAIKC